MRGLLVEDDHAVGEGIRRAFLRQELELDHATTLAAARQKLAKRPYPFLILDRCLPDGDSIHLCRERRAVGDCSYIAFFSGLAVSQEDLLECYESGADFAYTKAQSVMLFARHIKQALDSHSGWRRLGPLRVDAELHRLKFPDGRIASLSELEARFLLTIRNRAPHPTSESELVVSVWEGEKARERSVLPALVKRVRHKLAEFEWLIQTVHGERAYQLVVREPEVAPRPKARSGVLVRATGEFLSGQAAALGASDDPSVKQRNRKR